MKEKALRLAATAAGRPALVVLLRHGESMRNLLKKDNLFLPDDGSTDLIKGTPDHKIPLTDLGWQQARAVSRPLLHEFGLFDVAYDSGYLRTIQTREGALSCLAPAQLQAMKIRTNDLIHERLAGYTYDMTAEEVMRHFPYFPGYLKQFGRFYTAPPGGESHEQVCNRVYRFINILFRVRAGKKVLVVTHGGTIRAFRYCLEKWTADQYEANFDIGGLPNCSVTAYRFSPATKRLELHCYSKTYPNE